MGKHFQVLEVHSEVDTSEVLVGKKARFGFVMCFVKLWVENPVFVYVNEKFCNKN